MNNIETLSGEAFNIGGGPQNAISLLEILTLIDQLDHVKTRIEFDKWRTGDQKYYVSDTRKFNSATGWTAKTPYLQGIQQLFSWLQRLQEATFQNNLIEL